MSQIPMVDPWVKMVGHSTVHPISLWTESLVDLKSIFAIDTMPEQDGRSSEYGVVVVRNTTMD